MGATVSHERRPDENDEIQESLDRHKQGCQEQQGKWELSRDDNDKLEYCWKEPSNKEGPDVEEGLLLDALVIR